LEKPVGGDFDWGRIERGPVLGEGLVVVVDLEALSANSSDVLKRIHCVENGWVVFLLGKGVNRHCFGAARLKDSRPDAVGVPLRVNDGELPRCVELKVGEGGTHEKNRLVRQLTTCENGLSGDQQISHALLWLGVEGALLDLARGVEVLHENIAPCALNKAEGPRSHHRRCQNYDNLGEEVFSTIR
jgi:hypothetical protein